VPDLIIHLRHPHCPRDYLLKKEELCPHSEQVLLLSHTPLHKNRPMAL
jgi:hypothetical protein